jgi:hypothetical protein
MFALPLIMRLNQVSNQSEDCLRLQTHQTLAKTVTNKNRATSNRSGWRGVLWQ